VRLVDCAVYCNDRWISDARFLPRDAQDVLPSVRPSHAGITSKLFHCRVVTPFIFFRIKPYVSAVSHMLAAPAAWNSLPPSLQQLTNTDSFKRQLKTVLFERTEHNISTELLATTVLGLLQFYCFRPILLTTAYTDSVVDTWTTNRNLHMP